MGLLGEAFDPSYLRFRRLPVAADTALVSLLDAASDPAWGIICPKRADPDFCHRRLKSAAHWRCSRTFRGEFKLGIIVARERAGRCSAVSGGRIGVETGGGAYPRQESPAAGGLEHGPRGVSIPPVGVQVQALEGLVDGSPPGQPPFGLRPMPQRGLHLLVV